MTALPTSQPHDPANGCCPGQTSIARHYTKKRWSVEDGLQWGSDPSFCFHGFSCPTGTWTEDQLVHNLLRDMACMYSGIDIAGNLDMKALEFEYSRKPGMQNLDSIIIENEDASLLRLGKRNGHSIMPSSMSPSPLAAASPASAQRFSSNDKNSAAPPNKKRKCAQTLGQTLCHCRSEKKRRDAVGEGYRDLCRNVPGLENSNFTRKYILDEAARYLESLMKGNEELYRQLKCLELEQEELKDMDIQLLEELLETN
ncbi:hypothetical protein N7454_005850 [Penicillium verhagenii]|nr:hypothetical protein N7454_005850 [Penicillium verhagenii]